MLIGIPREIKPFEFRVAMTPVGVSHLAQEGHVVWVESKAGQGSGFSDREYRQAGARILNDRCRLFQKSELIVKVKEPLPSEFSLFRPGQILFTFLHLAANPGVTRALLKKKVTAIAYETVQTPEGRLPLLAPMSEIAGKMAALLGANYLRKDLGGKGIVLAGVGGKDRGKVLVLGVGNVGSHAAQILHGMGAEVTLFDVNRDRLLALQQKLGNRCQVLSGATSLAAAVAQSDLLIGGILIPGARAPRLVTRKMVKTMSPGSVIVDVAIDQGGCVEGIRPTTLKDPVYRQDEVLHCGVTNLPTLASRSATLALTEQTLPYIQKIAALGLEKVLAVDPNFAKGLNLKEGKIVHPAIIDSNPK